jgi:hypothetical protein
MKAEIIKSRLFDLQVPCNALLEPLEKADAAQHAQICAPSSELCTAELQQPSATSFTMGGFYRIPRLQRLGGRNSASAAKLRLDAERILKVRL